MTREHENIEGASKNFLDTRKGDSEKIRLSGGSENLYTSKSTGGGGGAPKNWTASEGGGAAKISSFKFQYLHPALSY